MDEPIGLDIGKPVVAGKNEPSIAMLLLLELVTPIGYMTI